MAPTTKYQLADHLLDGNLAAFMQERRDAGQSWDSIARAIWAATDQRVSVTGVTVAAWFDGITAEAS